MWKALLGLLLCGAMGLHAQEAVLEDMGTAVKRSLDRSRALYPDAALPDSPLSQAIMARISSLRQTNPSVFSDPDWPMKITAAEAARLGIPAYQRHTTASTQLSGKYLGEVQKSFSEVGVSFRKGQQIVIEELRDYKKKGVVLVDGQPVVIWLDKVRILRPLAQSESNLNVIKIESARYGPPDQSGYSVSDRIQEMVTPGGAPPQILVSDALIPPATAQRLNRATSPRQVIDPKTGAVVMAVSGKMLTVTYEINGLRKTKQALEGQTMVLD
jgi:hypothetical protein